MVAFPGCKINLGLHILGQRPDGYHSLQTCYVPLPWTDVLEILPTSKTTFSLTGLTIPRDAEDNLCFQAYQLLQSDFQLPPIHLHLHKLIPMGGGLGGGSADAAHTLRLLNSVFGLNIPKERLMTYSQELGSDCAFFCQDEVLVGSGRGEILEPARIAVPKGYFLAVITPAISISTREAYAGVTPQEHELDIHAILQLPIAQWREYLMNDFELSVFPKYPELAIIKEKLYSLGAVYSSMSGSGSSVYGIFEKGFSRELHFKDLTGWSGWL